jgi:hypothetical protein
MMLFLQLKALLIRVRLALQALGLLALKGCWFGVRLTPTFALVKAQRQQLLIRPSLRALLFRSLCLKALAALGL